MKIELKRKSSHVDIVTDVKYFLFSGGEVHIELPSDEYGMAIDTIKITSRIRDSDKLMELFMVTNALRKRYGSHVPIHVTIPYLPYARQDKISANGEALSLKVFADLINSQNYARVTCFDVHSDVADALINNLHVISQSTIINYITQTKDIGELLKNKVLVTPDNGAAKKIYKSAQYLDPIKIVPADKARDSSGKIIRTEVYADSLHGMDTVIIDDIADGSRTFIELAKVLRNKGAASVTLFVTHGIFSMGEQYVFDGGIDYIVTTNTFKESFQYGENILCVNVVDNLF